MSSLLAGPRKTLTLTGLGGWWVEPNRVASIMRQARVACWASGYSCTVSQDSSLFSHSSSEPKISPGVDGFFQSGPSWWRFATPERAPSWGVYLQKAPVSLGKMCDLTPVEPGETRGGADGKCPHQQPSDNVTF